LVLALLWLSGKPPPIPDLRLGAPVVARPGSTIGIRAWQLDEDDLGRVQVQAPETRVLLRDLDQRTVAMTVLARSSVEGSEGRLDVPEELDGKYALVAISDIDGREVTVERALYVRDGIDSKLTSGRTVNAFQAYSLGLLRRIDRDRGPSVLDPRIEEGACAPDLPCTLTVWVGSWQGTVRVRAVAGARIARDVATVDRGFAKFVLTVTGPEARVAVEALDDTGAVLSLREARLPLVPGGMTARAEVRDDEVHLEWHSMSADAPVLVDVFADHRWVSAHSVTRADPVIRNLGPGVWRLQLRHDLFSSNTGAVTFAVVLPDDAALEAAAELALSASDSRGLDPLAMAIIEGSFDGDPAAALRSVLGIPAFDVVTLGPGVSSRIGVDEAAADAQKARRWRAAFLILVVGLFVSVVLLRVEVVAQQQANEVLQSLASDDDVAKPLPVSGRGLWVLALFVFVVIAALALSKGWF
jgi:hypothetical protein